MSANLSEADPVLGSWQGSRNIKISPDGNTFVADSLIQPLDADGNVMFAGAITATVSAQRIAVGSYSAHP